MSALACMVNISFIKKQVKEEMHPSDVAEYETYTYDYIPPISIPPIEELQSIVPILVY